MAQKKAYSRYFIILQQDENGYSLSADKLPSGYTKLETKNDKCKISYYVQNLKKDMEPYHMVLICSKKDVKKLIKLGTMNIDDYGRTEITHEYNSADLAGSGVSIDMVTGAAVIKYLDSSIISIMSGFATTDTPGDWRTYDVFDNENIEELTREKEISNKKEKEEVYKIENKKEKHEAENIFNEYEEKIETTKLSNDREIVKNRNDEIENNENLEQVQILEDIEVKDKKADSKFKNSDNVEKNDTDNSVSNYKDTDSEFTSQHDDNPEKDNIYTTEYRSDKYPNGTVGELFRIVAEDFDEVEDVCKEIKRCKWYKVNVNSLDDMCNASNYNRYTIVYYPMMNYYPYISKYGHYIMGYKFDNNGKMKYLVYGIPGTKNINEQPYGGKSGFVTWVNSEEKSTRTDESGYWLMFYDFRTSTIVIPVK